VKDPTTTSDSTAAPVTSLDRALDILETVAAAGYEGMALGEIAATTGINKGSVHRLLAGWVRRGYVVQAEGSRAYALGETPHRLVRAFGSEVDLPARFRPLLLELSRQTEELVHLGVLDGRRVVYLDKIEPERSIRVWSRVGRRVHIATTSLGRALFAAGPQSEAMLTGYVAEADPDNEQPDLESRFRAAIDHVREHGWAIEDQENEPGVACVGVAMVSPTAEDVAISVTGLSDRMGGTKLAETGALLRDLATRLAPDGYRVANRHPGRS
jgi:IclR family acetate operon transcriptional repressor